MFLQNFHDLVFRHTGKRNLLPMAATFCTDIFALFYIEVLAVQKSLSVISKCST
jgi:hypothetical protein